MTQTEQILNNLIDLRNKYQTKTDKYHEKYEETCHAEDDLIYYKSNLYQGRFLAYRQITIELTDCIHNSSKYHESLEALKAQIKEYGVAEWIEAGANVLELGDAYLGNNDYARLERYHEDNALWFCGYEDMICGKCGQIILNNGTIICYNVLPEV
jgi:hypothetical protein